MDTQITYVHPKEYTGLTFNTPMQQKIRKAYVEANCLKCNKFNGKEHDFSECRLRIDCPQPVKQVSLIDPDCCIKCKSEDTDEGK